MTGAAHAPVGSTDMTTERVVAVFQHDRGPGRAPQFFAYIRDYNPAWEGCCMHRVEAASGSQAKAKAIADHKARTNCRGGSVFPTLTHRPEAAR